MPGIWNSITSRERYMLAGLAAQYSSVFLVNLKTKEYDVIKTVDVIRRQFKKKEDWPSVYTDGYRVAVAEEYIQPVLQFSKQEYIIEQLTCADESEPLIFMSKMEGRSWCAARWLIAERDEEGKPVAAFFVVSDIDEAKKRQQDLLKQMWDTTNAAGMGLWRIELFDDGTKPRMITSPKMRELLGIDAITHYTPEDVYEAWHSRICPEALDSVNKSVAIMLEGKRHENTYKWNHPTLGLRYVRCGGVSLQVPGKSSSDLIGYHYDVTEQYLAERERSIVSEAMANTYICLFYIDIAGNHYTSYRNTVKKILDEVPRVGELGKAFDIFAEKLCQPEFSNAIREFTDLNTLNKRLRHKNRVSVQFKGPSNIWCECTFNVCDRNDDGSVAHMIMGIKDIDIQKEEELRQKEELKQNIEANKSKTMMLQNMTHEIRTPLNTMYGFSQLLSLPDGSISEQEKNDYLGYIYNSFNMLSMLIDDVLDLADADHGNYNIVNETVTINDVCRNALQMADSRRQADVNLYFTSDLDDSYTIQSDGRRIQQVLVNYLTNACKHTIEGEIHLHCSTTETPGRLTFSVTDTGEGIPPEMAKDIFERFKKLNASVQGSGLGLNICNLIAEKLNGEVKLDTSYTNGARFLFIL